MSRLIKLGCAVADVYHRYHDVHGTLFGTSVLRRILSVFSHREEHHHAALVHTLVELQTELTALETEIGDPTDDIMVTGADRELRNSLLEYSRHLGRAVESLAGMCKSLERDEIAYRKLRADGRSQFTADKMKYDQLLSELERLGTRLERQFENY